MGHDGQRYMDGLDYNFMKDWTKIYKEMNASFDIEKEVIKNGHSATDVITECKFNSAQKCKFTSFFESRVSRHSKVFAPKCACVACHVTFQVFFQNLHRYNCKEIVEISGKLRQCEIRYITTDLLLLSLKQMINIIIIITL